MQYGNIRSWIWFFHNEKYDLCAKFFRVPSMVNSKEVSLKIQIFITYCQEETSQDRYCATATTSAVRRILISIISFDRMFSRPEWKKVLTICAMKVRTNMKWNDNKMIMK